MALQYALVIWFGWLFCSSEKENMQKYNILGLTLCDYNVREALRNTDKYLKNGALNTVAYISGTLLAQVSKDEKLTEYLERIDMTMCMDPDILEAAGIAGRSRVREIDEKMYFRGLLRKLARIRGSVYLMADSEENLETLKEVVLGYQENLNICGSGVYEQFGEQPERLVNELNDIAPKVIISGMPFGVDFYIMAEYKTYVNAELWLSLPAGTVSLTQNASFWVKLKRKLDYRKFIRQVLVYNKKTDSE